MRRRTRRPLWATLCALVALTACQTYRPLALADVRRGARVRVVAAEPVTVRLREITVDRARLIDAEAIGVDWSNLMLSALWVERDGGIGTPGEGWTVTVPLGAVASLRERRFSWWRTAVVGGALVAGTALGWRALGVGGSGDGGRGPGGEPL
ncbi:MAG: hypothetical protein EXR95_07625 [Gemmatimonadetes bacterium]|nr:hypothetical protein [Gemmatimonadota bacterium]